VTSAEGEVESVTGWSLQNLSLNSTSNHNTSAATVTLLLPSLLLLLLLAAAVSWNVAVKSCWSAVMVARSMA
jgi:hypothetical protein